MVVVNGRIVDFLIDRCEDGYAEFLFKSDYDKDCPRFEAICSGKIPDVVPGVPIKVEFRVETVNDITKIDFKALKIEQITKFVKTKYMNETAYTCINFNDEEYAKTLLTKVKGISAKIANRILEAVDGDISRLSGMWDDKAFWKGFRGSKKYLTELKDTVGSMLEKDYLVKKYQKYGIGYPQIDMLAAIYGLEAEEKLCHNPYAVLYRLELDFQVADNLAKDLNFDYLAPERVRAIIYQVLNNNEASGNTAMRLKDFYINCARLHRMSAWKDYVVSPYFLLSTLTAMRKVYYENGLIGYIDTLNMEADIAFQLNRLMSADTKLGISDDVYDSINDKYNKEQLEFLKTFDQNSVVILLGRGGTGKTHTICGAINLFKSKKPKEEIRLCAPTARAAGVLKEHSGHESSTMHIMLELNPYMPDDAGRNEENPLDADFIDPDQLESVGCGAVLRDLINSNKIPKIKLKKIMRQSEGSAVIDNCGKILAGRYDFIENDAFKIRNCKSEDEAKAYLKSCYTGDPHRTQILSTTKKGTVGTMSLNHDFEDIEQPGIWFHNSHFKLGDKVVFTKNNYDAGYCNGDIGFVETIEAPIQIKKQGEDNNVYIILPDKPLALLTRNMVNTAISRARKCVTLITINDALAIAASNKCKRNRITRLEEKLKNMGEEECQKECQEHVE